MWTKEFKAHVAEVNGNDPTVLEELKDVDIPCMKHKFFIITVLRFTYKAVNNSISTTCSLKFKFNISNSI